MGAWGVEPWQSDGAADWFTGLFRNVQFDQHIRNAFRYYDNYDEIRAACHLLAGLGQSGVWPGDLDTLRGFLQEGIQLLTAMVEPEADDDNDFLELWDHDLEVMDSVRDQISALQERLRQLGGDHIGAVRAKTFGNSGKPTDEEENEE